MRIWAEGKWGSLLTWCNSLHTQHFFMDGISGCKPEWVRLLAFFFSQNVFDDVVPGPSMPTLSPKCPESIEWCKMFDISYSEKNGLVMRRNRSVGGDGYGSTACLFHHTTHETWDFNGHTKAFYGPQPASSMSTAFPRWRCLCGALLSTQGRLKLCFYDKKAMIPILWIWVCGSSHPLWNSLQVSV